MSATAATRSSNGAVRSMALVLAFGCAIVIATSSWTRSAHAQDEPLYDEFGLVPEEDEGDLFLPDEVLDPDWPMPEARSRTTPDGGIDDEPEGGDPADRPIDDPDAGWGDPADGGGEDGDWAIRAGRAAREAGRAAAPGRTRPAPWGGPDSDPYQGDPPWGDEDVDPLGDLNGVDDHYLDPGEW